MKKSVMIAGEQFPTMTAAKERCRTLLKKRNSDDPITNPADKKLLHALFYSRPEKVAELKGRKIVSWGHLSNHQTICFAAFLDDGSHVHFSFIKSIEALSNQQNNPQAIKTAADPDDLF